MKLATVNPCSFAGNTAELDLKVLPINHLERPAAEQFIRAVFGRAYGANVTHFLPQIMALRSEESGLLAALGLRFAQTNTLFLEQYLEVPVEQAIAAAAHTAVARSTVTELGNLASFQRGGLRCLIIGLTAYLKGAGVKWAAFTAVPAVLNAFVRMGIPLHELGPADPSRLVGGAAEWGSYYEQKPRVVAGNVEAAYEYLNGELSKGALEIAPCCLWDGALRMGRERSVHRAAHSAQTVLSAGC